MQTPCAASVQAATVGAPPNIIQPHERLHRHALESVLAFLAFGELHAALQVSRSWQAAVGTMRPLAQEGRLYLSSDNTSIARLQSRMARHVGYVNIDFAVTPEQLRDITARLPGAWRLVFTPAVHGGWSGSERFPQALRDIVVRFADGHSSAQVKALLAALAQQQSLTALSLHSNAALSDDVNLEPLQLLPRLLMLEVAFDPDDAVPLSARHVTQLRALTQIRRLFMATLEKFEDESLLRVLRAPNVQPLQWMELPYQIDMTAAIIAELHVLPALQKVSIVVADMASFAFLANLPQLTDLRLVYGEEIDEAQLEHRLQTLPADVSGISRLSFHGRCSPSHVESWLSRTTQLHSLTLVGLRSLNDLEYLELVRPSLRELHLSECCGRVTGPLLRRLHSLQLGGLTVEGMY
jgi:hypothetical protein